jgi:tRNA(adenine34) deaminase
VLWSRRLWAHDDHVTGYEAGYEPTMRLALEQAAAAAGAPAATAQDVPVGAVVLDSGGTVIATGRNRREADADPTAHAEIVAIRAAGRALGTWRLEGCALVVTLEPCTMCAGAVLAARLGRLVYGAPDPRAGAAGSLWDVLHDRRLGPPVEVITGVLANDCAALLRGFFAARRTQTGEHGGTEAPDGPALG